MMIPPDIYARRLSSEPIEKIIEERDRTMAIIQAYEKGALKERAGDVHDQLAIHSYANNLMYVEAIHGLLREKFTDLLIANGHEDDLQIMF